MCSKDVSICWYLVSFVLKYQQGDDVLQRESWAISTQLKSSSRLGCAVLIRFWLWCCWAHWFVTLVLPYFWSIEWGKHERWWVAARVLRLLGLIDLRDIATSVVFRKDLGCWVVLVVVNRSSWPLTILPLSLSIHWNCLGSSYLCGCPKPRCLRAISFINRCWLYLFSFFWAYCWTYYNIWLTLLSQIKSNSFI